MQIQEKKVATYVKYLYHWMLVGIIIQSWMFVYIIKIQDICVKLIF